MTTNEQPPQSRAGMIREALRNIVPASPLGPDARGAIAKPRRRAPKVRPDAPIDGLLRVALFGPRQPERTWTPEPREDVGLASDPTLRGDLPSYSVPKPTMIAVSRAGRPAARGWREHEARFEELGYRVVDRPPRQSHPRVAGRSRRSRGVRRVRHRQALARGRSRRHALAGATVRVEAATLLIGSVPACDESTPRRSGDGPFFGWVRSP